MRTLPRLKGISANLRKQLINSNDEQTIESMARYMPDNEILELTDQQLGYQPVVLGLLDREPLSVEIMTRMSRLPDGVGPLNLRYVKISSGYRHDSGEKRLGYDHSGAL